MIYMFYIPASCIFVGHKPRDVLSEKKALPRITTGRAHRKMPIVDFGQLPLQKAECMHVVLYNRTGIATPFSRPESSLQKAGRQESFEGDMEHRRR